jgi:hypothetical protein
LIAELRTKKKVGNCDCRPSKFDFRNSLQSPASSFTLKSLFLGSGCFEIQPKTIFTIICFNGNQKLVLKGQ